jgi:hypothetical protein
MRAAARTCRSGVPIHDDANAVFKCDLHNYAMLRCVSTAAFVFAMQHESGAKSARSPG